MPERELANPKAFRTLPVSDRASSSKEPCFGMYKPTSPVSLTIRIGPVTSAMVTRVLPLTSASRGPRCWSMIVSPSPFLTVSLAATCNNISFPDPTVTDVGACRVSTRTLLARASTTTARSTGTSI